MILFFLNGGLNNLSITCTHKFRYEIGIKMIKHIGLWKYVMLNSIGYALE